MKTQSAFISQRKDDNSYEVSIVFRAAVAKEGYVQVPQEQLFEKYETLRGMGVEDAVIRDAHARIGRAGNYYGGIESWMAQHKNDTGAPAPKPAFIG